MSFRIFATNSQRCSVHGMRPRLYSARYSLRRQITQNSGPQTTTGPHASPVAALASLTDELDKIAPRFDIMANQIHIFETPTEFYEVLKAKIRDARRHIFLSTLYIGHNEHELLDTLRQSLLQNHELTVSILTDYLRGNRETPAPSCATLLLSLVKEFPERVEVRMYHTPNLVGLRKKIMPKRINEGWGLQHMKLYGFDDEIMLSGANLSSDYFTNRQDRYHLLSSKPLTAYYHKLYRTVANLSFRLQPNDQAPGGLELIWPATNPSASPLVDAKAYIKKATSLLGPLLSSRPRSGRTEKTDTQVYPVSQLTPLLTPDHSTELPALRVLLNALAKPGLAKSSWTFTAGYFNMTPEIRGLLLATRPADGTVIAASPWANGFYGSKGVSGMLPSAYTYLSRQFVKAVGDAGLGSVIRLKEWRLGTVGEPGGWTYHAKGLWITVPDQADPWVTLIGSSNYTKRSYSLDLESNALIVTRNAELARRLGQEQGWLQKHATRVDETEFEKTERRVRMHVRLAMWIVKLLGGAL